MPKKSGPRDPNKPDIDLGKRIRNLRIEKSLSQTDLGNELGISFQQIQKYEKGMNRVSAARLNQIARIFAVPLSYFYNSNDQSQGKVDSLLIDNDPTTLRLLRAYSRIASVETQHKMVELIETIAADYK